MLRWFTADLHIHTVLSPCADLLMGPQNIIERAQQIGLDILAIADHNSAENVEATIKAAEGTGITIIPGMEVTSQEEAHFICLFPTLDNLLAFQIIVNDAWPPGENDPDFFGPQYVVNEKNEVMGENTRLLILATALTMKQIVSIVNSFHGLVYPAHVDRKGYSMLNQLGFVPQDLKIPAMEISWNGSMKMLNSRFPETKTYPFITASDAHEVSQMGRGVTRFFIKAPTLYEIKMALHNLNDRKFKIEKQRELE
jgi:PHP family Zn ribbon phosphoesterase